MAPKKTDKGKAIKEKDRDKEQEKVTENAPKPEDIEEAPPENLAGCFARVFWMVFGNFALVLAAFYIFKNREGFLTILDAVYLLIVVALVVVRYLDITKLNGATTSGKPATLADWRKYFIGIAAISVVLWIAAHAGAILFSG